MAPRVAILSPGCTGSTFMTAVASHAGCETTDWELDIPKGTEITQEWWDGLPDVVKSVGIYAERLAWIIAGLGDPVPEIERGSLETVIVGVRSISDMIMSLKRKGYRLPGSWWPNAGDEDRMAAAFVGSMVSSMGSLSDVKMTIAPFEHLCGGWAKASRLFFPFEPLTSLEALEASYLDLYLSQDDRALVRGLVDAHHKDLLEAHPKDLMEGGDEA